MKHLFPKDISVVAPCERTSGLYEKITRPIRGQSWARLVLHYTYNSSGAFPSPHLSSTIYVLLVLTWFSKLEGNDSYPTSCLVHSEALSR